MRVRALLRGLVVAFVGVLGLVVYLNWTPAPTAEEITPIAELPAEIQVSDDDRAVDAVTDNVTVSQTRNGVDVFTIQAAEHVQYADGWSNWAGVTLTVHGREGKEDVVVVGDTMRSTGEVNDFDEVRIVGNVRARLPGGGGFSTRRLIYDAVTGVVSNCNRNTLLYAGIEVRADCLHFETAGDVTTGSDIVAEELRMWGDLTLRAADELDSGMPADLRGASEEMRFATGGEVVRLSGGEPVLEVAGANVRGDELVLDVGKDARHLRGVEAVGNARARYRTVADPEIDDDAAARLLRGDILTVGLTDGRLTEMAVATEGDRSRMTLPESGRLDATRIAVATDGDHQRIAARGDVTWQAREGQGVLRELVAERLDLVTFDTRLDAVEAADGVTASLAMGKADPLAFSGPRLTVAWTDAGLGSVTWPEGVEFEADGRAVVASEARFDPTTSAWTLDGTPEPRLRADGVDLSAAQMRWTPGGGISATGGAQARVGDDYLTAAAALFGDTTAVDMRADSADVDEDGALTLSNDVEVVWERQSLLAGRLLLEPGAGRLSATRDVELVLVGVGPEGESDAFTTLTATNLLVEQGTSEIRVAGSARLRQGGRRIQADRLTVALDESGNWASVLAEDQVTFRDGQAEATAESMLYEIDSGAITLEGSPTVPAVFRLGDIEYRSTEAPLRIAYEGDNVLIESTENGRTRTTVIERGTSGS